MNLLSPGAARLFLFLILFGCSRCLYGEAAPFPDPGDPLSGMGVNIHFTDARPGELEMLSQAGFRWIRMDLTWKETERTPGVYDFSAYDRLLASLDKFHLRALLIFDFANDLYDNGLATHTDEGRVAFARWAVAAVTHFKDRGVLWEIWNEPDNPGFWKPKVNADDYARLALTVSKAIHEAAPDEVIVGPASCGSGLDFLEVSAKAGVFANWSDITIHPYVKTNPENYGPRYDQTRQLIKKYALPGQRIEVMCGESGYSTAPAWAGIDDGTQGKYLARLFLFDVLSGVPLTIWYDWHDDGNDPKDPECNFGIVRYDYHDGAASVYDPKPAYDAARTYSQELAGYRFKERVKTESKDDFVLSFTKDANTCLVAWTATPAPHEVKIPAPDGTCEVTSYNGKKKSMIQSVNGAITLSLDGGPQYIKRQ